MSPLIYNRELFSSRPEARTLRKHFNCQIFRKNISRRERPKSSVVLLESIWTETTQRGRRTWNLWPRIIQNDLLSNTALPFLERVVHEKETSMLTQEEKLHGTESKHFTHVCTYTSRQNAPRCVAFYGASEFFFHGFFVPPFRPVDVEFRPSDANRSPNRYKLSVEPRKPDGWKTGWFNGRPTANALVVRIFFDDSLFEQPLWSALRALPPDDLRLFRIIRHKSRNALDKHSEHVRNW